MEESRPSVRAVDPFVQPYWMITPRWTEPRRVLHALRHLPPDTPLPTPATPAAAEVLRDLLSQADEDDPRDWLVEHRSTRCARLALIRELLAHPTVAPDIRLAGGEIDDVTLRDAIARVHATDSLDAGVPWTREPLRITTPLISVLASDPSATADPVRWVARHRAVTAAEAALAHITRLEVPEDADDHVWALSRPTRWLTAVPLGLRVRVCSLAVGRSGFVVTAQVKRRLAGPRWHRYPVAQWSGFDEVTDDLGYSYLPVKTEGPEGRDARSLRTLRQRWYPAPHPDATALHLTIDAGVDTLTGGEHLRQGSAGAFNTITIRLPH